MSEHWEIYADWNPWHGCTKVSPGCKFCYVYRQDAMYGSDISSSLSRKTANFNLPVKRKRDKSYKIESGKIVFTCFTSDFFLSDADPWRPECWQMMRERSDLYFYFFTKRIDRFMDCLPPDWGDGYDNVLLRQRWRDKVRYHYDVRVPVLLTLQHPEALPYRRVYVRTAPERHVQESYQLLHRPSSLECREVQRLYLDGERDDVALPPALYRLLREC